MKKRYQIVNQHGEILSKHATLELAEKQKNRNLAWRCGICGSNKSGWGKCRHGNQNLVCSAKHYNDSIIFDNE